MVVYIFLRLIYRSFGTDRQYSVDLITSNNTSVAHKKKLFIVFKT